MPSDARRLGLYCTSGAVCWGATRANGVKEYIEEVSTKNPRPSGELKNSVTHRTETFCPEPAPTTMPPPSLPPLPSQAGPSQLGPPSTAATLQPDFVPSTFPDETQGAHPGQAAQPAAAAETPGENSSGESQEQRMFKKVRCFIRSKSGAHATGQPLRKRAAGASARKPDLFADLSIESPLDLPPAEQPSLPPTQRTVESQSLNTPVSSQDSVAPSGILTPLVGLAGPLTEQAQAQSGSRDPALPIRLWL